MSRPNDRSSIQARSVTCTPRRSSLARAAVEAVEARRLLASVAGVVFNDANANGKRDPGEAGLYNEVVYADRNNNNVYDGNDVATRADASGAYKLAGLPADGAAITVRVRGDTGKRVVAPAGNGYAVKLTTASPDLVGKDFAVKPLATPPPTPTPTTATIAGRVTSDANANGIADAGDAGIGFEVVYLDRNNNGIYDATDVATRTDANGAYLFSNVALDGAKVAVRLRGIASPRVVTAPAGAAFALVLNASATRSGLNFSVSPGLAIVAGRVADDANKNGVADPGEAGLAGVGVFADYDGDGVRDADEPLAITDATGAYKLSTRRATFDVRFRSGLAGGAPYVLPSGAIVARRVDATSAATVAGIDFAAQPAGIVRFFPTLYDENLTRQQQAELYFRSGRGTFVWDDLNGDFTRQASEPLGAYDAAGYDPAGGLPGAAFTFVLPYGDHALAYGHDGSVGGTTSGAIYASVSATSRDQTIYANTDAVPCVITGALFTDLNRDGYLYNYALAGPEPIVESVGGRGDLPVRVYADYDNDGTRDADEPQKFVLRRPPAGTSNFLAGRFVLTLRQGRAYTLRIDLGDGVPLSTLGCAQTVPMRRAAAATFESNANVGFAPIVPPPTSAVDGYVFLDRNQNGTRDAGEAGVAGAGVLLDLNNNSKQDAGDVVLTTDANGHYAFTATVPTGVRVLPGPAYLNTWAANRAVYPTVGYPISTGVDFAVVPSGTAIVRGNFYLDDDANGIRSPYESSSNGFDLGAWADLDNDGLVDADEPRAFYDPDRLAGYSLHGLPVGVAISIRFNNARRPDLIATGPATDDHAYAVTLAANEVRTGLDFGVVAARA